MNFRPHWLPAAAMCVCVGGPWPSTLPLLQRGFQREQPEGSTGEEAAWEPRRWPARKIAARGGAPIVQENSAAPSGKWPPAGGGSGCPRQGAQRERAEPGPGLRGLPSPAARSGARQLLPAARASAPSVAAQVPGAPRPWAPGNLGRATRNSRSWVRPWSLCPRGWASWVPAAAREPGPGQRLQLPWTRRETGAS